MKHANLIKLVCFNTAISLAVLIALQLAIYGTSGWQQVTLDALRYGTPCVFAVSYGLHFWLGDKLAQLNLGVLVLASVISLLIANSFLLLATAFGLENVHSMTAGALFPGQMKAASAHILISILALTFPPIYLMMCALTLRVLANGGNSSEARD